VGAEYNKKVVRHSWDLKTGEAGEPVELIKGKALDINNIGLTEDRRHAAVSFSTSAVTVYSLADGKPVAKDLKGVSSPENALVEGKRLYSVEPSSMSADRTLKAIDLESGKVAWDRPLKPRSTVPLTP